jgi:tetratricopeptide (TPR) repeat protein
MAAKMTIQDTESESGWGMEQTVGLVLFCAVFLFYGLKAPEFAVPGRWAGMLSSFFGLEPSRLPVRPLWSGLMALAARLPAGQAAHLVNLLSALLGATVSLLLFTVVRRIPFAGARHLSRRWSVERWPRLMAGLFAGLIGAVAYPIMTVATQGDFFILDALLLLLPLWPALAYLHRPQRALVLASFVAFGLGLAEYPTLALLLPGFFLWWIWQLWKNMQLRSMLVPLAVVLLFGTAVAVMLPFAAVSRTYLAAGGGEAVTLFEAWQAYFKLYGLELLRSVPKVGWLLLVGTNVLPLIFVVFRPMDEPADLFSRIGVYSFRLILFVLGVATLFELPGSPGRLMGFQVMVVAPYLVAAMWFGHLLGYYYGLATRPASRWPRRAWAGLWLVVLLGAGVVNHRATTVDELRPVVRFADEVVARLQGRTFLITDGTLDASLRLSARQAQVPLHLINARNDSPVYAAHVASLVGEPALKNAAHLGLRALLQEWMHHPTSLTGQVAVLTSPHTVPVSGLTVVPAEAFYVIRASDELEDPEAWLAAHRAAWAQRGTFQGDRLVKGDAGQFQYQFVQRWSSRLANDLGVALDDRKQPGLARQAYEQALAFWPDNISPTLNLLAQVQREGDAELEAELTARIKLQAERNPEGVNPAFFRQISGEVRNPMVSFEAGSQLVRAGQRDDAMAMARRTAELLDGQDASAQVELARLFMRGRRLDEADRLLAEVLEKEPDHRGALMGRLQLALARRELDEAGKILDLLEQAGLEANRVALERAGVERMAGRTEQARKLYLDLTKKPSPPAEAWFSLALLAEEQKDAPLLEAALAALKKERAYAPGQYLLGDHALAVGHFDEARRYFERVLVLDPAHVPTLGRLAQLDFDQRNAEGLRRRTAALLAVEPDHYLGHFFAASVHLAAGRNELAETALRKCLAVQEYDLALNDLAWILHERGENEEALTLSRRALELGPGTASSWETLASILEAMSNNQEARAALEKALELAAGKDPGIMLHAVRFYMDRGLAKEANAILEPLRASRDKLSRRYADQLAEVERRL